jgi:predicted XRE-type DNA-binding protein
MNDAKRKGRNARGSGHGRSKLTSEDIAFVRSSTLTQREIADTVGVTQGHVSAILAGKRWSSFITETEHAR